MLQSFQEKVGPSEKLIEFTLVEKTNLSFDFSIDRYYTFVLSYKGQLCDHVLLTPGQNIAIFPKNLPNAKDSVFKHLPNVPFSGIPFKLEEKKAVHEQWKEVNSHNSGLNFEQFLVNVRDLNRLPDGFDWISQLQEGDPTNENNNRKFDCAKFIGELPPITRRLYFA